jgi:hypothetical protein
MIKLGYHGLQAQVWTHHHHPGIPLQGLSGAQDQPQSSSLLSVHLCLPLHWSPQCMGGLLDSPTHYELCVGRVLIHFQNPAPGTRVGAQQMNSERVPE